MTIASPLETVSNDIQPVTLQRHDSAASLMRRYWSFAVPDIFEEADARCLGDNTTPNEMLAGLEQAGFWAFADVPGRIVHVWSTNACSRADLIALLAHEIGHCVGAPLEDEDAEENRANSYGFAAATALGWVTS